MRATVMYGAGDVLDQSLETAVGIVRPGVTISGGPAPARAYIEELMPDVLEGRIDPGRVFDRVTDMVKP